MTKMDTVKAQLEKTIKLELTKVQNQLDHMAYLANGVNNLRKGQRREYRNLLVMRDCFDNDLQMVKGWDTHKFVKALHNDEYAPALRSWLGWN